MFEPNPRPSNPATQPSPLVPQDPLGPPAWTVEDLPRTGQSVAVSRVRTGRRFGLRWVVAALAVVLVASASVAAGSRLLAAGQTTTGSGLAAWAPAGTVMYAEFHPDAPGDQHAKLAAFASHFPGFSDTARLDANLAEMYDELLALKSKDTGKDVGSYSTDIAPWFGGEVAVAVTGLPTLPATTSGATSGAAASHAAMKTEMAKNVVGLVAITDPTAAGAWVQKRMGANGATVTTSTYGGAQLYTRPATSGDGTASVAVLPDLMVVGETKNVQSVVDGGGKGGLAASAGFASAQKSVTGDNLAAWYVNVQQYVTWAQDQATARTGAAPCAAATTNAPDWVAGALTANASALTSHSSMPHVANHAVTTNTASALISHLPASTLVAIDVHDVGASVAKAVDQMRTCAASDGSKVFDQIDSAVKALGGWDSITGWMGEAAIAFQRDGSKASGGIVIAPKDKGAADTFATEIHNLIALAGDRISATDETYAGRTLTVITSPDAPASAPKIAFVFTPDLVVVGVESWVKDVLDTTAASSLASDARFQGALAQVPAQNAGLIYANVSALRDWSESTMPSTAAAKYEAWAPYFAPFDAFIGAATVGSDLDHVDSALTVK